MVAGSPDAHDVLRGDCRHAVGVGVVEPTREVDPPERVLPRREAERAWPDDGVDLRGPGCGGVARVGRVAEVERVVRALVVEDGAAAEEDDAPVARCGGARVRDRRVGLHRRVEVDVRHHRRPEPGEAEVVQRVGAHGSAPIEVRVSGHVGTGGEEQVLDAEAQAIARSRSRQAGDQRPVGQRDARTGLMRDHVHVVLRVLVGLDRAAEAEEVGVAVEQAAAAAGHEVLVDGDVVPVVVGEVATAEVLHERLAARLHFPAANISCSVFTRVDTNSATTGVRGPASDVGSPSYAGKGAASATGVVASAASLWGTCPAPHAPDRPMATPTERNEVAAAESRRGRTRLRACTGARHYDLAASPSLAPSPRELTAQPSGAYLLW